MLTLGLDIGSSSVKVSLFDADKGVNLLSEFYPKKEMMIHATMDGWAEQNPEEWFNHVESAIQSIKRKYNGSLRDVKAIGISYQMHGLVAADKQGEPVRNAIIWCDSRAVKIGMQAYQSLGEDYCQNNLLNSPGNFTASKLKWIKDNEPQIYGRIHKIMLPGDYIAYRLTGDFCTTESGLSEGIFWDFKENKISEPLLHYYGFDIEMLSNIVPTFGIQGYLKKDVANKLGLNPGIPVTYRAGDQPNNAFSLNVLNPGEIAATAGTSGVVYGVTDIQKPDTQSRVNTFLHVNNKEDTARYGILLCINGTGILNSWMKHNIMPENVSYGEMNELASTIESGSDGLLIFPFGNGAERVLGNKNIKAQMVGLDLNKHSRAHLLRATQEGIVFALNYGIEVMQELGVDLKVVKAAKANMFQSKIFRQSFATLSGAHLELYNTNGSEGAARGAAIGIGFYKDSEEAFQTLEKIEDVAPQPNKKLTDTYESWKIQLKNILQNN